MSAALAGAQSVSAQLSVVDAGLMSINNYLIEMQKLAFQAAATQDDNARASLNTQFGNLRSTINAVVTNTWYNGRRVISTGAINASVNLMGFNLVLRSVGVTQASLVANSTTISTKAGASAFANVSAQAALSMVAIRQGRLGGYIDIVDAVIEDLENRQAGLTAAAGAIGNADEAAETANIAKQQIRLQYATAVIAQANILDTTILKLLGFDGI